MKMTTLEKALFGSMIFFIIYNLGASAIVGYNAVDLFIDGNIPQGMVYTGLFIIAFSGVCILAFLCSMMIYFSILEARKPMNKTHLIEINKGDRITITRGAGLKKEEKNEQNNDT